jgi:hypothetical protein
MHVRGELLPDGPRRVTDAWGAADLGVELTEETILLPESNTVLSFLVHPPIP